MIKIELAKTTDLDGVMKVIKACSADLISKKIFQWSEKYPSREVFKNDIDKIKQNEVAFNQLEELDKKIYELKEIVSSIEEGDISIDEISSKVKRAAVLLKICKASVTWLICLPPPQTRHLHLDLFVLLPSSLGKHQIRRCHSARPTERHLTRTLIHHRAPR